MVGSERGNAKRQRYEAVFIYKNEDEAFYLYELLESPHF